MIDCVVFFITLNLISTQYNLSNDSSLLAIVKFEALLVLPLKAAVWDKKVPLFPILQNCGCECSRQGEGGGLVNVWEPLIAL